jgi:hypothetical protein
MGNNFERRQRQKINKAKKAINEEWAKVIDHYRKELLHQMPENQVDNLMGIAVDRVNQNPKIGELSLTDTAHLLLHELAVELRARFSKRYQTEADLVFARNFRAIRRALFGFLFDSDYRKSEINNIMGTPEQELAILEELWFEEFDAKAYFAELKTKFKEEFPEAVTKMLTQYLEVVEKKKEQYVKDDSLSKIRQILRTTEEEVAKSKEEARIAAEEEKKKQDAIAAAKPPEKVEQNNEQIKVEKSSEQEEKPKLTILKN